jgi:transposase
VSTLSAASPLPPLSVPSLYRWFGNASARSAPLWLHEAKTCSLAEFRRFARGLEKEYDALSAALSEQWSNGQVEGQITRLKFLKRQMYGRAKIDLLRLRVLHPT